MKNECSIIRDLLPLYAEELVSEDSAAFVEAHLKTCPACSSEFQRIKKPASFEKDAAKMRETDLLRMKKLKRDLIAKMQLLSSLLMMLGMIVGLGLTTGGELFYNTLIMPFVGILGYLVFRWRAVYWMPVIFLATHAAVNLLNCVRGMESLDFISFLWWTLIYSLFIAVGVAIAFLFHFALKKEKQE